MERAGGAWEGGRQVCTGPCGLGGASRPGLLPSSSSSDVMDLERSVSAVVGARFGGGGAVGRQERQV